MKPRLGNLVLKVFIAVSNMDSDGVLTAETDSFRDVEVLGFELCNTATCTTISDW